jgi:hypothetical protein
MSLIWYGTDLKGRKTPHIKKRSTRQLPACNFFYLVMVYTLSHVIVGPEMHCRGDV